LNIGTIEYMNNRMKNCKLISGLSAINLLTMQQCNNRIPEQLNFELKATCSGRLSGLTINNIAFYPFNNLTSRRLSG
jgi:hypothetical protein